MRLAICACVFADALLTMHLFSFLNKQVKNDSVSLYIDMVGTCIHPRGPYGYARTVQVERDSF